MDKASLPAIRRTILTVAFLNAAYFVVEFVMAIDLGSVSLFADSVDFLEDTAINLLVFFALTWSFAARRTAGSVLAGIILIPAVAALVTAVMKIVNPVAPEPGALTTTAVGALIVNVVCAVLLMRFRDDDADSSGLVRGAWLAARNDALANILIILAGLATFLVSTAWFDIVAGLIISYINFTASKEVWEAARFQGDPMELLDDD
ncbi:cation transporter [Trueperella pecoris]|uniref:Cation transporter n=1 Tax=Trueperella pecoris TaxID=2733571 RepID=A0A7M1QSX1_9ACTO|nr:cation transporter [Trueperella pecoris]QOQ38259.1 cation transporter [Trueperella pecoris]QOR45252.1 cation transporter [Trueperella pecoris]QTG75156.1 cation transporter [Trueperella pecoris]